MSTAKPDWNPGAYAKFRGLRLRPALDLLAQVRELPVGDVIDLGCGDGAAAEALASRFPDRRRIGVDASPAMLEKATGYDKVLLADIAAWQPETPPALIFSNAVLQWLPDHVSLLPRLARSLAPKGTLAVQIPRQFNAPSHRFLRDLAVEMFADRFDFSGYRPPVAPAVDYHLMLAPLGRVTAWESDYVQALEPCDEGHPVRAFTGSTAMRPFLERLTPVERAQFTQAYDRVLASAYPLQADGGVLFPFRRTFFVLEMP